MGPWKRCLRALLLAGGLAAMISPATSQGDAVADCDRLAMSPDDPLRPGPGVEWDNLDPARAVPACAAAIAADPRSARLRFQLGRALDRKEDYAGALAAYSAAAEQGYGPAMNNLGLLHENGHGTRQDYAKAAELYRRAVAAGYMVAGASLGHLYEEGLGVGQNHAEALRLYRPLAEAGDAWAQLKLGWFHESGLGVPKNDAEAAAWYAKAAAQDYPAGQNNLATLYLEGRGVAKDEAEALRLYGLAAAGGDPFAMKNLGRIHQFGRGIAANPAEAERWYRQAVAADHVDAMNKLAWMWAMQGEKLDEARVLAERAVAATPDGSADKPAYLDTLGWVALRQGRFADAARDLERAVGLNPVSAPLRAHLGDAYAALGRLGEARTEWERALGLPPPEDAEADGWNRAAVERKLAETE